MGWWPPPQCAKERAALPRRPIHWSVQPTPCINPQAVADGKVETLTLTVGTQRRAVLEAVAYGVFLRDVESWVDGEYALLSPHRGGGSAGLSL